MTVYSLKLKCNSDLVWHSGKYTRSHSCQELDEEINITLKSVCKKKKSHIAVLWYIICMTMTWPRVGTVSQPKNEKIGFSGKNALHDHNMDIWKQVNLDDQFWLKYSQFREV